MPKIVAKYEEIEFFQHEDFSGLDGQVEEFLQETVRLFYEGSVERAVPRMAMTGDCQEWRDSYVEGTIEASDSLTYPMVSPPPVYNWFKPPWWERDLELAEHLRKTPPLTTREEGGTLIIEPVDEPGD